MLRSTVLRIGLALPTLFGVLIFVFLIIHMVPGDPARAILGVDATEKQVEQLSTALGLKQPLYVQFTEFLHSYLRGDFGTSFSSQRPVAAVLGEQLPYSAMLVGAGGTLAVVIGVPLGLYSALRPGRVSDRLGQIASAVGVALPEFWIGLLMALAFSIKLRILPAIGGGSFSSPGSMLERLVMPAIAVSVPGLALITRMTRANALDVLGETFVRAARARGISSLTLFRSHVLPNIALPVLTVVGLVFGTLLSGTIAVEVVFARPGVGSILLDAILARDYPLVEADAALIAAAFIAINLFVDISYYIIDPRLRRA